MPRSREKTLTSIRIDAEDRQILALLRKMTGQPSSAAIFRLAIREALAARTGPQTGPESAKFSTPLARETAERKKILERLPRILRTVLGDKRYAEMLKGDAV